MSHLLAQIDTKDSGEISRSQFIKALRSSQDLADQLGLPSSIRQESVSRSLFQLVFDAIDTDESKTISLREFLKYYNHAKAQAPRVHPNTPRTASFLAAENARKRRFAAASLAVKAATNIAAAEAVAVRAHAPAPISVSTRRNGWGKCKYGQGNTEGPGKSQG